MLKHWVLDYHGHGYRFDTKLTLLTVEANRTRVAKLANFNPKATAIGRRLVVAGELEKEIVGGITEKVKLFKQMILRHCLVVIATKPAVVGHLEVIAVAVLRQILLFATGLNVEMMEDHLHLANIGCRPFDRVDARVVGWVAEGIVR